MGSSGKVLAGKQPHLPSPPPLSQKRNIMNETQKQKQKGNLKKWGCQYLPQYAHLVPVLLVRGDSSHSVLVCLCFCVFCVCVQYSSCSAVGLTTPHVTRYGSIPPSLPLPGFFFLSLPLFLAHSLFPTAKQVWNESR